MKKKAHFSYLIYTLLALTFHTAFSSPLEDTQFFIELPEPFLETLNKNADGKVGLWHPRLTVHKVPRSPQPHKVATLDQDNGFLSFMQLGAGAKGGDGNVVILPNQDGVSLLKSSKMNCQCRFVKDAAAGNPISVKQTSFVQTVSERTPVQREANLWEQPHKGGNTVLLEEPKHKNENKEEDQDEVKALFAELQAQLDQQAEEAQEKEEKKEKIYEEESSEKVDMKMQMMEMLRAQQEQLMADSESSSEDTDDLLANFIQMNERSESESEMSSGASDEEKLEQFEEFSKFVEMYNMFQEFNGGKLATNKKSKSHRKQKMLLQLDSEGSDDGEKLRKTLKALKKKGYDSEDLMELMNS